MKMGYKEILCPSQIILLSPAWRFGKLWEIAGVSMKTCNLYDFMKSLSPWLDDDYIRKACLDENGHFALMFTDGVKNVYHIEDCEKSQLEEILEDLKKRCIHRFFRVSILLDF
jgi:hypothetical protein